MLLLIRHRATGRARNASFQSMGWALIFLLFAAPGRGQEPQFKMRADEVVVPVSVTTKSGKPVENLSAKDFVVLNDGNLQTIRLLSSDESTPLPIYTVLVVQADEGSEPALAKIKKTAGLIGNYITNDMGTETPSLAAVITVGTDVHVAQNFTADPNILDDTFAKISGSDEGTTHIVDGVNLACNLLAAKKDNARRLVVLISESRDQHSKAHFADIAIKAQKENIVIYTISYSPFTTAFTQKASDRPPPPDQPGLYDPDNKGSMNLLAIPMVLAQLSHTNVSEAFAQATGGSHGKFTTLRGLENQLIAIGNEVHNRYTLTFVPSQKQAAGYHKLSVSVRRSGDWRVYARPGYWNTSE